MVILFVAISADNYIAAEDGSVAFLDEVNAWGQEHNFDGGFSALLEECKVIIMGSKTYEQIVSFGPWAWKGHTTYVLSSQNIVPVDTSIIIVPTFLQLCEIIKNQKHNIWLCGGAMLIEALDKEGLIDRLDITQVPQRVINGIPLKIDYSQYFLDKEVLYENNMAKRLYHKK